MRESFLISRLPQPKWIYFNSHTLFVALKCTFFQVKSSKKTNPQRDVENPRNIQNASKDSQIRHRPRICFRPSPVFRSSRPLVCRDWWAPWWTSWPLAKSWQTGQFSPYFLDWPHFAIAYVLFCILPCLARLYSHKENVRKTVASPGFRTRGLIWFAMEM